MRAPNFTVVEITERVVLVEDCGPWDEYPTITNNPEPVVAEMVHALGIDLGGRELHYIDSDGQTDRILVEGGKPRGFAPVTAVSDAAIL